MSRIEQLTALEILDSRGKPTVQATCRLVSGATGTASVPSGASTGSGEALELRDENPRRYRGLGCRQAVAVINDELNRVLTKREFNQQNELDQMMIVLDGTPNKTRLGANSLLAVSLAFARAIAAEQGVPLYRYLAEVIEHPVATLPRPMINLFSGGKHAGGQIPVQDIQIIPVVAQTMADVMAVAFDVYYAAVDLIAERYGMRMLRADEGGLAPDVPDTEAMLTLAVEAIQRAGFKPGDEIALALDVAATHFYRDEQYCLGAETLTGPAMVERLLSWLKAYPLVSIEDGLAESDWDHWQLLRRRAAKKTIILGDDLLCTNPMRIRQAVNEKAANALLLKVNQIGTLTEAAEAYHMAKTVRWQVVVSARSGETEDDWLADLAVGWSGDYIKVGSITQSERLAKYNRLLAIEQATGLPLAGGAK